MTGVCSDACLSQCFPLDAPLCVTCELRIPRILNERWMCFVPLNFLDMIICSVVVFQPHFRLWHFYIAGRSDHSVQWPNWRSHSYTDDLGHHREDEGQNKMLGCGLRGGKKWEQLVGSIAVVVVVWIFIPPVTKGVYWNHSVHLLSVCLSGLVQKIVPWNWTAQPFVTKLGAVLHHHELECDGKTLRCYL